ncbi:hypothetical protein LRP67_16445 [Nocardioides sp. cx-169]|uniref:hypothetical protein n=1 Tax=Nocardioides sp. cx-169 TaxID=2899080 RepID=UPI001E5FDB77|nr:hypothetical protein [Nocardioides sp. cx-169]MCD4535684.1 hypothetical protein [Nocardioides sp. cx-169]
MSKEVPETWAKVMKSKGFTHNDKPSVSRLAGATSLATETVRRMVFGIGTPEQRNVNEVADVLGVSRIRLNEWIGIARSVEETYEPPADADLMDHDQRKAVDRVIQLFVEDKRAGGHGVKAAANTDGDDGAGGAAVIDLPKPPPKTDSMHVAARRNQKRKPRGTTEQPPD